ALPVVALPLGLSVDALRGGAGFRPAPGHGPPAPLPGRRAQRRPRPPARARRPAPAPAGSPPLARPRAGPSPRRVPPRWHWARGAPAASRSLTTTRAPPAASRRASAAPIPDAAPVTTTRSPSTYVIGRGYRPVGGQGGATVSRPTTDPPARRASPAGASSNGR